MSRDGVGQEAVDDAGQVQPGEDVRDLGAGEDVCCHEASERLAQAEALIGDDGGVRDRYAEGMAEQGCDREPIGDTADEPRLG